VESPARPTSEPQAQAELRPDVGLCHAALHRRLQHVNRVVVAAGLPVRDGQVEDGLGVVGRSVMTSWRILTASSSLPAS